MKIPKFTDEEAQILENIDALIQQRESSIGDVELQMQKRLEAMKRIINNYDGGKSLESMKEMVDRLKELQILKERYSSEENALIALQTKIYVNVCNR